MTHVRIWQRSAEPCRLPWFRVRARCGGLCCDLGRVSRRRSGMRGAAWHAAARIESVDIRRSREDEVLCLDRTV